MHVFVSVSLVVPLSIQFMVCFAGSLTCVEHSATWRTSPAVPVCSVVVTSGASLTVMSNVTR